MHFDFEAYGKVFPSQPEPVKQPETMAEGFEPTKDEMAKDNKPGEPEKVTETPAEPEPTPQPQNAGEPANGAAPEGSNENG